VYAVHVGHFPPQGLLKVHTASSKATKQAYHPNNWSTAHPHTATTAVTAEEWTTHLNTSRITDFPLKNNTLTSADNKAVRRTVEIIESADSPLLQIAPAYTWLCTNAQYQSVLTLLLGRYTSKES
jgi:hypothetical protein